MLEPARRFLPRRAEIDAYGDGGFRFADMSHRGSLLCLPSGMHAWPVASAQDFSEESFAPVLEEAAGIELLLVGTGRDVAFLPEPVRGLLREHRIAVDIMPTNAAARTWNVLLAENRLVAAALVAVA
jgi:uncharacterized protein